MALVGPTSIVAGAAFVDIAISVTTTGYQPLITPSWNTTYAVTSATPTTFHVEFGTPAPLDGSGVLYWEVVVSNPPPTGQLRSLQDYLDELRFLLHDPQDQYFSTADKIKTINAGIQRRDLDTGANRQLFPFTLTVGQDTYSFADLVLQNPGPPTGPTAVPQGAGSITVPLSPHVTPAYQVIASTNWNTTVCVPLATELAANFTAHFGTPAPAGALLYWQITGFNARIAATQVFDIVSLNLLYNNLRYVMGTFSFSEMNATVRQYNPPLTWAPVRWCRYGPNTVIFGPAPSVAYVTEWDCSVYSAPLTNLADVDLLPYPYTQPVPYYAAYKNKLNERQYDEAEDFLDRYRQELNSAVNARVGTVPSMYANDVSIVRLS